MPRKKKGKIHDSNSGWNRRFRSWLACVQAPCVGRRLRRLGKVASRPVVKTLDRHAVKNWRNAPKFGSLWLSLFVSALSGAWVALPAFQYVLPAIQFGLVCVGLGLLIGVVRLIRQPGVDD